MNTTPVPSQTPHDESDRRTEPRSSVSDLVNSLTSEMLMVSRQEGPARAGGRAGRLGIVGRAREEMVAGGSVVTSYFPTAASCLSFPICQMGLLPPVSRA